MADQKQFLWCGGSAAEAIGAHQFSCAQGKGKPGGEMERSVDCGRVAKQEALFETESTTGNRAVVTIVLRAKLGTRLLIGLCTTAALLARPTSAAYAGLQCARFAHRTSAPGCFSVLPRAQPRWSVFEEPAVYLASRGRNLHLERAPDPLKQEMLESVIREYQWLVEAFRQPH